MYYEEYGEGQTLIFLHGWGQNLKTFYKMKDHFEDYHCILIDLPGFGQSEEPKGYSLDYYVNELRRLIDEKNLRDFVLIGHSFGGRIAIKYASKYCVKKIILIDSAGIIHHNYKYFFKVMLYKVKKRLHIQNNMGSSDYLQASPVMRRVLCSVTNESLIEAMKRINAQALLVFGEEDTITPVDDGRIMEKYIRDSGLVIIPRAGHFSYLDNPNYVYLVLDSFIVGDAS